MTLDELAQTLQSVADDQSQLRQLNALIKPLRIVRDRPRAAVSLLVDAAKFTRQQNQQAKTRADIEEDGNTRSSARASSPAEAPAQPSATTTPAPPHSLSPESPPAISPIQSSSSSSPLDTDERSAQVSGRKRTAQDVPEEEQPPKRNKSRNLSTSNLLTRANRRNRQHETETALGITTSHGPRNAFVLDKWSPQFESLEQSWEALLANYPPAWSQEQRLFAIDEALFKASLLQPEPPIADFLNGLSSWIAQWIDPSQRSKLEIPLHLRGKREFQEFWAIDRNLQSYQSTHVITSALLRLSKVHLAEKYEDLKQSIKVSGVKRKRGQTAAAKAKEIIFETTFPHDGEREAAKRRFAEAQHTSAALLELCQEHSYGVLILIPPGVKERDLRSTTEEFRGFQAALRLLLSNDWPEALRACGNALTALSQGRQPSSNTLTQLKTIKGGEGCESNTTASRPSSQLPKASG